MRTFGFGAAGVVLLSWLGCSTSPSSAPGGDGGPGTPVSPTVRSATVPNDPDDPAIWLHPSDPSRSLVLGTDKIEKVGGLHVFGLDGRERQVIAPLDRPNNVDVEYGFMGRDTVVDIAVLTERKQHRLRVYAIDRSDGHLRDLAPNGLPVLDDARGEAAEPMGIALYRRPRDGAVFAIVAPKTGPASGYLAQYRLDSAASGTIRATFVRRFGAFSGLGPEPGSAGEIEAIVVDDALGYVYYADERCCLRKYHADPDHEDAGRELASFGREGYQFDREGLAIYAEPDGRGYLVSTDQIPNGSVLRFYAREGRADDPHDHVLAHAVATISDQTDGLEITSRALPGFPRGLAVMMNSRDRNFLFYRWQHLIGTRD